MMRTITDDDVFRYLDLLESAGQDAMGQDDLSLAHQFIDHVFDGWADAHPAAIALKVGKWKAHYRM